MTGPLQGIRVIRIGIFIVAPFVAPMLVEFLADMMKTAPHDGGSP